MKRKKASPPATKLDLQQGLAKMVKVTAALEGRMARRISGLEARMTRKTTALDTKVNALDTKVNALDTKVSALDTKVNALDTRITDLEKNINIQFVEVFKYMDKKFSEAHESMLVLLETQKHDIISSVNDKISLLEDRVVRLERHTGLVAA